MPDPASRIPPCPKCGPHEGESLLRLAPTTGGTYRYRLVHDPCGTTLCTLEAVDQKEPMKAVRLA